MKKNEKYDKVIANFDLDFIKNKFDNDNVAAPESLNGENVKNAIDDKEQKIIPFVKAKALRLLPFLSILPLAEIRNRRL